MLLCQISKNRDSVWDLVWQGFDSDSVNWDSDSVEIRIRLIVIRLGFGFGLGFRIQLGFDSNSVDSHSVFGHSICIRFVSVLYSAFHY